MAKRKSLLTILEYPVVAAPKARLKPRKNQPNTKSRAVAKKSFLAPFCFRSSAANAGLKVKELKAEIRVETAIVSANCR